MATAKMELKINNVYFLLALIFLFHNVYGMFFLLFLIHPKIHFLEYAETRKCAASGPSGIGWTSPLFKVFNSNNNFVSGIIICQRNG